MKAVPGVSGAIAGWLITGTGLTPLGIAVVAMVSCLFGMVSSASRVAGTGRTARLLLMNAGAVSIAAMALASSVGGGAVGAALIGLGVGLAGPKVLEVLEAGAISFAERATGRQLVSKDELSDLLGELRQDAQKSISEQAVTVKPPRRKRND